MPLCIMPNCPDEGRCLHALEVPGSVHLLCGKHFDSLFRGQPAAPPIADIKAYNRGYNAILDERRALARLEADEIARKEATNAQEPRQEAGPEGQGTAPEGPR